MYEELRFPEGIEKITIQEGWHELGRGYFCLIERDGICIEDFGITRRSALRYARRAWRKEKNETVQRVQGYPRKKDCQ